MKVVDVMASGQIKERASVLQSKTQKPVRFEISEGTRASVEKWMEDELMVGSECITEAAEAVALGQGIGADAIRTGPVLADRRTHRGQPDHSALSPYARASALATQFATRQAAVSDLFDERCVHAGRRP